MKKYFYLTVLGLTALAGLFMGKSCSGPSSPAVPSAAVLQQGEKEKVHVNLNTGTVTTVTKQETKQVGGVRYATVTLKEDGTVSVDSPVRGWVFEPGFAGSVTPSGPRIGLDCVFFYWHRVDLIGGVAVDPRRVKDVSPYLALGYWPDFKWLSNTDLFAGITNRKEPIVGIRIEF